MNEPLDPQRPWRGSIFVEDGLVLRQEAHPGEQFIIRIQAPACAKAARPGSFVHLQCDSAIPMRRPLSIMRVDREAGWIDVLYKIVGDGLRALSQRVADDVVSVMGPIGMPFEVHPERPRTLMIGGGVGIPPMVFLAESLAGDPHYRPLVLMGSEIPFPFTTVPSTILLPGMPEGVIASIKDMEQLGIATRLASNADYAGCYAGYVTELARLWLASLSPQQLREVEIFACGPTPMLEACARVAQSFEVPAQISLEEFMACATGGCAGCAVQVQTADGPAMKRVCVDGPVFDANEVFPAT